MKFIVLFSYSLALLLLVSLAGAAPSSPEKAELRVACEKDFNPYCFTDGDGRSTGFGADLIQAVANEMDIPVKVYSQTWDASWNGLVEGRFDALPIVAKLPSRAALVDFSLAHTETFDSFFVRDSDPVIRDIKGASGKEIIVMRSDAAHHALMERGFDGKIIPVDTVTEMMALLASGRHDALLCPKLLGVLKMKEMKITGIKAGPTIPDYKREFSFAVRKGDTELLEKLNQGLLIVKSNGEYRRIYEKWLSFEDPWQRYAPYVWPATAVAIAVFVAAAAIISVLQTMVRRRTAELAEKNAMLKLAKEDLNEKVRLRTAELHEANGSLEKENAERRLAESTLRESEERYRLYIEVTGQLGWVTDADGMVASDIPAWRRYTGQSYEETKGAGWANAIHPEDVGRTMDIWKRSVRDRTPYEAEFRLRRYDGAYRYFLDRSIPIAREDGTVREWVGTAIDITERKHAEDALREAHEELENRIAERTAELETANLDLQHEIEERKRMEGELIKAQKLESLGIFAGGIAHDFNNLLQTLTTSISVAKMHAPEGVYADALRDAETASKYASHLSRRLLTFAKGGSPVKKVASLTRLIEETKILSLSGSNIACESVLPEGLHPVEIDEGQICQVFTNILINAKESMPGGGTVRISAVNLTVDSSLQPLLEPGEYVKVSVEDQGTGISDEDINRIFDPYFSTKARGAEKGTGLGLSVCHSIITKHGGLITVESKMGAGSVFHVFLPACSRQQAAQETREARPRGPGGRILFMEDERNMWKATRLLLKTMGYEVDFTVNGTETASLYRGALESGRPYDGVILDLTIPGGMGGRETIQLLKEMDAGVKALVVSGYTDDPVLTNFKEFGFIGALAKPYSADQLRDTVLNAFSREACA